MVSIRSGSSARSIVWLTAIAISAGLHWLTGRWDVRMEPDSASYLEFSFQTWEGVFRGIRTPGYPLFLKVVLLMGGPSLVPFAHWLVMIAATLIWYRGLVVLAVRSWVALLASLPLLFSAGTWELGRTIGSDALGISLAIASSGFFFAALAYPKQMLGWWIVGMFTIATILVRPAFLFLIPFWPILAVWLRWAGVASPAISVGRLLAMATVGSMAPFLLYCGLRSAAVGEFGLVSFAGYNLIGVTGQWLSDADLESLPESERNLARAMIANRARVEGYQPPDSYEVMVRLYNATVWGTAAPAAEAMNGKDSERNNQELKSLAVHLLWLHPSEYLRWLLWNGKSMVDQLLKSVLSDIGSRLMLLTLTICLAVVVLVPSEWCHRMAQPMLQEDFMNGASGREFMILWWTAIGFAVSKGLLVILVEPALGRYVLAAGCLLPTLVGWFVAAIMSILPGYLRRI